MSASFDPKQYNLREAITHLTVTARDDRSKCLTELAALVADAVPLPSDSPGVFGAKVTTRLLLANDTDAVLQASQIVAQPDGDGWLLSGKTSSIGGRTGDRQLLLVTKWAGGGLVVTPPSATGTDLDRVSVTRDDVVAILGPQEMSSVRLIFDIGVISVLVGLADCFRARFSAVVAQSTVSLSDRWAGQSLKHRLADLTSDRDAAWLALSRAINGKEFDALQVAIGLHEGISALKRTLEEYEVVCSNESAYDADSLRDARDILTTLETTVGGAYRLKDRISALVLG